MKMGNEYYKMKIEKLNLELSEIKKKYRSCLIKNNRLEEENKCLNKIISEKIPNGK